MAQDKPETIIQANEKSFMAFPNGLRVMVVDDDPLCLKVVEQMLKRCNYEVTTCTNATTALQRLRDRTNEYDLVLSDVYMPDMDGFKLLETIGLELEIPVIMMSSNGETSTVMRGVTHGAVDFLIKPVRIEELRNLWQHVVRRKKDLVKELDSEDHSQEQPENPENSRKRKDLSPYSEGEPETDRRAEDENAKEDGSCLKKARVVWSAEMHSQFVTAVSQLGIDKAVPKKILEMMGVHGLTRENVASHLQKYRLYLKRVQSECGGGNNYNSTTVLATHNGAMNGNHASSPHAAIAQAPPRVRSSANLGVNGVPNNPSGMGQDGSSMGAFPGVGVSPHSMPGLGLGPAGMASLMSMGSIPSALSQLTQAGMMSMAGMAGPLGFMSGVSGLGNPAGLGMGVGMAGLSPQQLLSGMSGIPGMPFLPGGCLPGMVGPGGPTMGCNPMSSPTSPFFMHHPSTASTQAACMHHNSIQQSQQGSTPLQPLAPMLKTEAESEVACGADAAALEAELGILNSDFGDLGEVSEPEEGDVKVLSEEEGLLEARDGEGMDEFLDFLLKSQ